MKREDLKEILRAVAIVLIAFGAILLFDELWMFGFPFGHILPDLTVIHIEPLHHWMWGIIMIYAGIGIFMADLISTLWTEEQAPVAY